MKKYRYIGKRKIKYLQAEAPRHEFGISSFILIRPRSIGTPVRHIRHEALAKLCKLLDSLLRNPYQKRPNSLRVKLILRIHRKSPIILESSTTDFVSEVRHKT
jgi:hypothetical protein